MSATILNNTDNLQNILSTIDALPNRMVPYNLPVATEETLGGVKSGADIIIDTDGNMSIKNDSHNHSASTITSGIFSGAVVAQTSTQTPNSSLIRNSKLVSNETSPDYNGEICWMYE